MRQPSRDDASSERVCFPLLLGAVALAVALAPLAQAQDDATLDQLLNLPTETAPAPAPAPDAADPQLRPEVQQLLEAGDAADALEAALRQMEAVSTRLLERLDPGLETQREQESILRKLDQVIAAAQQQQESPSGGSGSSSGGGQQARQQDVGGQSVSPQQAEAAQPGGAQPGDAQQAGGSDNRGSDGTGGRPPGEAGDRPLEEVRREWGNLPPRLRDELTEGLNEEFSPAYRELTEQYYRALAETE